MDRSKSSRIVRFPLHQSILEVSFPTFRQVRAATEFFELRRIRNRISGLVALQLAASFLAWYAG